jgi:hypothetical protein
MKHTLRSRYVFRGGMRVASFDTKNLLYINQDLAGVPSLDLVLSTINTGRKKRKELLVDRS